MTQTELWKFISEGLRKDEAVMLLCVADSSGSSPGRQGYKMAVTANHMHGSIGGGVMEHKFVELSRERLRLQQNEPLIRRQLHDKSAARDQSGMICSGEQTIILFPLFGSDLPVINSILDSLENLRRGTMSLSAGEFTFTEASHDQTGFSQHEGQWKYIEETGYINHLYIIGGGHCALALSELMLKMDFYIHNFEDRPELNTFVSNKFVHEKIHISGYSELSSYVPSGINNYVVIMTFGYRTDDLAVRALINKDFRYFGVLGSESKMKRMFAEWRKDSLPENRISALHAPVGINIKSETPMEIAVSIAAEIIAVKNAK